MRKLFYLFALIPSIALAQNAPSGSPRVQGAPDGFGDPVQVTVVAANGADMSGATASQVQGNIANGVADSGNPIKTGCVDAVAQASGTTGVRSNMLCFDGALMTALTAGPYVSAPNDTTTVVGFMSHPLNFGLAMTLGTTGTYWNGTALVMARGDTNGQAVHAGLGQWTYASGTTGILSNTTTAVTFKTAAGASVRNFVDSCQISTTAFGAAVPLAIRDGAGGTVLWAATVPTTGYTQPITIAFQTPLRSTANTLLEIVTTTANVTGSAMVNCQGHTGS